MLPHIKIGVFSIPSYTLMMLIGLIAFTVVTIILIEKKEKAPQKTTNRLLIISVAGFATMGFGALLLNSLFHSIEKGELSIGGITWLGGVLFAFPLMVVYIHKFCPYVKGEALEYFNLMIPGIVVAHGFGRIGCFLGGCCYGAVTDSVFGVSFPDGSLAAKNYPAIDGGSLPVLPTQLFEAAFEFILFALMIVLYKKLKHHFLEMYALGYGAFRFLLEFLRGDDRGATGLVFSPSQLMSLVLIAGGVLVILYHRGVIGKKLQARMKELRENRDDFTEGLLSKKLKELKKLLDEELISQQEFDVAKQKLLERFTESSEKQI